MLGGREVGCPCLGNRSEELAGALAGLNGFYDEALRAVLERFREKLAEAAGKARGPCDVGGHWSLVGRVGTLLVSRETMGKTENPFWGSLRKGHIRVEGVSQIAVEGSIVSLNPRKFAFFVPPPGTENHTGAAGGGRNEGQEAGGPRRAGGSAKFVWVCGGFVFFEARYSGWRVKQMGCGVPSFFEAWYSVWSV